MALDASLGPRLTIYETNPLSSAIAVLTTYGILLAALCLSTLHIRIEWASASVTLACNARGQPQGTLPSEWWKGFAEAWTTGVPAG